jgi:Tol biopolymer transport system component
VLDLERRTRSRLTFGGINGDPVWSSDGRRIAYGGLESADGGGLFWKAADGSGEAERIVDTPDLDYSGSFSPDDRLFVYERFSGGTSRSDLWVTRIGESGEPQRVAADDRFTESNPDVSPDGRFVAYTSDESGVFEVFVRPFPTGAGKWQISTEGGIEPRWSPEGDALYFRNRGTLYRVPIRTRGGLVADRAEAVFTGARLGINPRTYDILPGGQGIIALRAAGSDGSRDRVHLALGWGDEVRSLMRRD